MPDQDDWIQGNLSERPLPILLFHLWQSERTGLLRVKQGDLDKILGFKDGQIATAQKTLPSKDFLRELVDQNILDPSLLAECENYTEQNRCSLLKALHELSPLRPAETWTLMEVFIKESAQPLFDLDEGTYEFDSDIDLPDSQILSLIPTLPFILQGIRRMKNHKAIEARIPDEKAQVQILNPYYFHQIKLEPPENYLLNVLKRQNTLKPIYETSELGKKETEKILFSFQSLGLISFAPGKTQERLRPKSPPLEVDKKLVVFNNKFSYIYKYISKELGPVAFNLLEKCIEELKPHLSPLMKQVKFDREGRVRVDSILKTDIAFASAETKKDLIRDLNEILVAEVLTVKKNLGDEHESMLVNNLNRIGEKA